MSGFGTSFMKIWTCGSSLHSGSRNARTRIKNVNGASRLSNFSNFFFRRDPKDFMSRLVNMGETWLYHYDPETKQQTMECRHSGSSRPKKFRVQKSAGKFLAFFGEGGEGESRRHPPHWLSSKGPNYEGGVLLISAGAIEEHFEGETPREGHQGGPVLARQCPGSTGTCNPEETGLPVLPISWSPTQFSGSGPVGLPPVPWTEKKTIEMSLFFVRHGGHCCRGDLFGRTILWIFFWVAFRS